MAQPMDIVLEDSKNFRMPMTFDGKRMRKAVLRKTVDYNASIIKQIQMRKWFKDLSRRHNMQPDESYAAEVLPPSSLMDNPVNAITTKFVRTSTNKLRCPIFCVVWTPEGRRLVTGASSGEFTLWNGLTFNFETILQAHETPVRAMVWSHSDAWLVSSDHGGYVKYWQSNMNNVKMYEAHKEPIRGLSFSPVDNKFASCSDDGLVKVWDFLRCTEEKVLRGHGADVKCIDWHPHKSLLVSGSKDNQQPIKLWDPRTGSGLATLHAHKSTVMSIKWNQNGNWLLTASRDHLIKLFDIRMMREMQTFRGHKREATTVAWHPIHEALFASGGSDGSLMFWLVGAEKDVGNMEAAHDGMVWSLAWHPLGHILCSGSNDHSSKFWTRNRLGDKMRDKYNLNLQCADDEMGESEIASSLSSSSHTLTIPGMDTTLTAADMDYPEFDGYDAADQAAKQRNMAKKNHPVPAPAWPPASGAHNGVPGIMPGILAPQIPVMRPVNEVPPEQFNSVGPVPGRRDNRASVLRPDARTFQPDAQHNPRMPTPFEPSAHRFGGPDYGFRRPGEDFGEGRSHHGRGSRWSERRNFKEAPDLGRRTRRPWEDHQSSNWPLGPDDEGVRSKPPNDYGQEPSHGSIKERSGEYNVPHGHFADAQSDSPGRDFRPGLLGSPPRAHESDNRPGLLGPPPQPGSEGSGMGPAGAPGNPILRGSLLGQHPGPDQNAAAEETPRRRSNEQEDTSFPSGLHPPHPQDLSSRGFRSRAHGKGLDPPFREDRTENRPPRGQPFAPRGPSRSFVPGPADQGCPEPNRQEAPWGRSGNNQDPRDGQRMGNMGDMQAHSGMVDPKDASRVGPGRQNVYGVSDPRDPRSQSRSGEPVSGMDDSRFHAAGPPSGSFEKQGNLHGDHGPHDFRGRSQFPPPAHSNSAGPSDSGPGRGPARGIDQNSLDPPGSMGDGKPSIPSLMSINPLPYPSDEKKFGDRDAGEFRGRKRSADGEGFRDGDPSRERGPPKHLREDDDWRRPPRSQMDGPREEWRGPPEDWKNGRFSEEQYEDPWSKEQFRRDDYGKHGPQGNLRGGWRGRGGRR